MVDGDRLVLGAFVLSAVLAGGNAVGIRFSNMELQPYGALRDRSVVARQPIEA